MNTNTTFYCVLITTTHAPNGERDALVLTNRYYYQHLSDALSEYRKHIALRLRAYLDQATTQYERIEDATGHDIVCTITYGTRSHVIRVDKVLLQEVERDAECI